MSREYSELWSQLLDMSTMDFCVVDVSRIENEDIVKVKITFTHGSEEYSDCIHIHDDSGKDTVEVLLKQVYDINKKGAEIFSS